MPLLVPPSSRWGLLRPNSQEGDRLGHLDGLLLLVGEARSLATLENVRAVRELDIYEDDGRVAHGGDGATRLEEVADQSLTLRGARKIETRPMSPFAGL